MTKAHSPGEGECEGEGEGQGWDAVDKESPLADDGGDGQPIEHALHEVDQVLVVRVLGAHLPRKAAALRKRPLVEVALLVVAAVDVDGGGVGELVAEEEEKDLERVLPPIRDVAVEQVRVVRRRLAMLMKDPQHVLQLPVRVAADEQPLGGGAGRRHALERTLPRALLLVQLERRRQHLVHAPARDRRLALWTVLVAPQVVGLAEVTVEGGGLRACPRRRQDEVAGLALDRLHRRALRLYPAATRGGVDKVRVRVRVRGGVGAAAAQGDVDKGLEVSVRDGERSR